MHVSKLHDSFLLMTVSPSGYDKLNTTQPNGYPNTTWELATLSNGLSFPMWYLPILPPVTRV